MKKINLLLSNLFLIVFFSVAQNDVSPASVQEHASNFSAIKKSKPINNKSVLVNQFTDYIQDSIADFNPSISEGGNAGVIYFDKEIWVSKWATDTIMILDSIGTVKSAITVAGVRGVRSFTTDGTSIFAGNSTDTIYVINPTLRVLDSSIVTTTPSVGTRVCAYDPKADGGNGGFWIANFTSDIQLVSKQGVILSAIPQATHQIESMYGGFVDTNANGTSYLALYHQGSSRNAIIEFIEIPSGTNTGIFYDTHFDFLNTQEITAIQNPIAGGLFLSNEYVSGQLTVMGVLQGQPDIIFGLDYNSPDIICENAIDLKDSTTTNGDIILSWTSPAIASNLTYGPVGFTNGTGTTITNVTSPYTLSGLPLDQTYEFRVEEDCGSSSFSYWSLAKSFSTPVSLPFNEDFSLFTADNDQNPWPSGWISTTTEDPNWTAQEADGTDQNSTGTGPNYDNTQFGTNGGIYLFLETTSATEEDSADMVSPLIFIDPDASVIGVRFAYHMYGNQMGDLKLLIDSGAGAPVLITQITGEQQTDDTEPWRIFSANLSGYENKNIRVILRGIAGDGFRSDMAIDDVSITSIPNIDAGLSQIIKPELLICSGTEAPIVNLTNFGKDTLTAIRVYSNVNGVLDSVDFNGQLLPFDTIQISLPDVTYNLSTSYNLTFYTKVLNGTDTILSNDTLSITNLRTGLEGNYTIDSNSAPSATNWQSFTDFANDLNTIGICSSITVEVVSGSGPYNEQVIFDSIPGADANNTILIKGNNETIAFGSSVSAQRAVLKFDKARWITIDSLSIDATGSTYGWGAHITNGAHHINILNSTIETSTTSSSSANFAPVVINGSNTSLTTASDVEFVTVDSCTLIGGYYGIDARGISDSTSDGFVFTDNIVQDFYLYGIYLQYSDSAIVSGNDISRPNRSSFSTFNGIYFTSTNENALVSKNRIHNNSDQNLTSTSAAYPIYFSSDASEGNENYVINNLIYSINGEGTTYGIYDLGSNFTNYYNNTISLDNTAATKGITRGFYQSAASNNSSFLNNIISITRGGSSDKHGIYLNNAGTSINADYNGVFVNSQGTGDQNYGYFSSDLATLSDWQLNTSNGTNSFEVDPKFVNLSTDDLTPNSGFLNASAFSTPLVTEDFFGVARGTNPDIGAIEFTPPANDASITALLSPELPICAGTFPFEVELTNAGSDTLKTTEIFWNINGSLDSLDYTGAVAPGKTDIISLGTITINSGVLYDLSIYSTSPNNLVDADNTNDTTSFTGLRSGIVGAISIDSSQAASATNYISFSDLANELNEVGACGAIDVTVAPGTYNDVFYLNSIFGLSATSRLTINGVDTTLVTLRNNSSSEAAAISLSRASYVTIKNITILGEYTGSSEEFGIHISSSNYDSIVNCRIVMDPSATTNVFGIGASADITNELAEGDNANFTTVINCNISGGGNSIHFEGGAASNWNVGNTFINNTLSNMDDYGFYFDQQDSITIVENTVNRNRSTGGDGIYLLDGMNFKISKNKVIAEDYGIYVTNANSGKNADDFAELINNMVTSYGDYGIYLTDPIKVKLYHNSVYSEGSVAAVRLRTNGTLDSIDVRNNIFFSKDDLAFEADNADTTVFLRLDNNVYYTTGADLLEIESTTYTSLAAYRGVRPRFNVNSIEGDPQFTAVDDLHILGNFVNDIGDNSLLIDEDIDGDVRPSPNSTIVDPGADEFDPPLCSQPLDFRVSDIAPDSALIEWTSSLLGNDVEYEYGELGFVQGTGTIGISITDSIRINGLMSQTEYDVYIREICGRGDTSAYAGPISFETPCFPFEVDYFNDFEDEATASEPTCWFAYNTYIGDGKIYVEDFTGTRAPFSGDQALYLDSDNNFTQGTDSLIVITNKLSGMTLGDKRIRFFANTEDDINALIIATANRQGNNATFTPIDTIIFTSNNDWKEYIVDITVAKGYNGTDEFIAFAHSLNGTFDDIRIDDFRYEEIPTCFKPDSLEATANGVDTATLSWNETATASSWQIEYDIAPFNDTFALDTVVMNDTTGLNNLLSNTTYEFRVRAICAVGDTSYWSSILGSFETNCDPFLAPYFNDFENDQLDQAPDCWFEYVSYPNGFVEVEDFGGTGSPYLGDQALYLFSSTGFTQASDTLIAVSPQFSDMSAGDKRIRFFANSDDPVSQLIIGTINSPTPGATFNTIQTINFPTPDTYQEVIVDLTTANGYNGTDEYIVLAHNLGGTSDYIRIDEFNYEEIPSCIRPSDLNATVLRSDSVSLSWTENNTATEWQIEYDTVPFTNGEGRDTIVSTNPFELGGLMTDTDYEFRVRAICTVGDTSAWSSLNLAFRTPCVTFTAPYTQDFENSGDIPACMQQGINNEKDWEFDDDDDHVGDDGTITGTTLSGGLFAYIDDSSPHETNTTLLTPFIDVSGLSNPTLEFYRLSNNEGQTNVDFTVEVFDGTAWNQVFFADTNSLNGAWEFISISLTNLTITGPIQARFVIDENNGTDFYDDMAIDDIFIGNRLVSDVGISDILSPISLIGNDSCSLGSDQAIMVQLENFGTSTIDSVDVTYIFNGGTSITETFKGLNLGLTEKDTLTLGTTIDFTVNGTYSLNIYTQLPVDGDNSNDTTSVTIINEAIGGTIAGIDSICGGDTISLFLENSVGTIQWQELIAGTWTDISNADSLNIRVSPADSADYRVVTCGSEFSNTFRVISLNLDVPTIVKNDNVIVACGQTGTDTLVVSTPIGNSLIWYDDSLGNNVLETGDTLLFTGSPASAVDPATDTFYVASTAGAKIEQAGPVNNTFGGGGNFATVGAQELLFDVNSNVTLKSVLLYPNAAGDVEVELRNAVGTVLQSRIVTVSNTAGERVTLDFDLVPGSYELGANAGGTTTGGLYRNNAGASFPYTSTDGSISITQTSFANLATGANLDYYYYFYDWEITSGCESPRTMVIGNVGCLVGLEDQSDPISTLKVYPNPSQGLFTLDIESTRLENYNIALRDISGKIMFEENITVNGQYKDQLDFTAFAKGVYFLQINSKDVNRVEKLIIQ